MKKKLTIIFALCFTISTVVNATANVEMNIQTEETTEVEQIVEPEFSLLVETVTEIGAEAENEAEEIVTEVESDIIDDVTEGVQPTDIEIVTENETFEEVVDEIETEPMTETVIEENPSEYETEIESELSSMPMGEVTETETMEVATEIIEEDSEYVEAVVDAIVIGDEVTTERKEILVQIKGENLFNKYVNIKVRPTNTYKDFYYIRTIVLEDDFDNMIRIALPEESVGLYRVDVDVEKAARETKVIAIGESDDSELKCEVIENDLIISGKSVDVGIKAVMVKIMDNSGNIVCLRQTVSAPDGSYTVDTTLPADIASYVVWVTIEGEAGGYVKTITPFNSLQEKYTKEYICPAGAGIYEDVVVYAKNISDMSKYTYELDYSKNKDDDILLVDICALTRTKEIEQGFSENERITILSVSNRKIRFTVNGEIENGKLWSGLLNIIRFKRETSDPIKFILRVYE